MTDERLQEIKAEMDSEDLFDDLMHPFEIMQELLNEVERLRDILQAVR